MSGGKNGQYGGRGVSNDPRSDPVSPSNEAGQDIDNNRMTNTKNRSILRLFTVLIVNTEISCLFTVFFDDLVHFLILSE